MGYRRPPITFVPELRNTRHLTSYSRSGLGFFGADQRLPKFRAYASSCHRTTKIARFCPQNQRILALIHRPMTALGAHMWISYSPTCGIGQAQVDVGSPSRACGMRTRLASRPPPIEPRELRSALPRSTHTPSGCLYHWASLCLIWKIQKNAYCAATLDLLARADYERNGDVNESFSRVDTRWTPDGDTLTSTTAADCSIALLGERRACRSARREWESRPPADTGRDNPLQWALELMFGCRTGK